MFFWEGLLNGGKTGFCSHSAQKRAPVSGRVSDIRMASKITISQGDHATNKRSKQLNQRKKKSDKTKTDLGSIEFSPSLSRKKEKYQSGGANQKLHRHWPPMADAFKVDF